MITKNFAWLFAAAFALVFWSCSSETVAPKTDQNNDISLAAQAVVHPDPDPVCSDRVMFDLMDESGGMNVNYCDGAPCGTTTDAWGTLEVLNSDSAIYFNYSLPFGWYSEQVRVFIGDESELSFDANNTMLPVVTEKWLVDDINPVVNAYQGVVPFANLPQCFNFSANVSAVKLNFFTGIDYASRTSLWVKNDYYNDNSRTDLNTVGPTVNTWCVAACGPTITSIAGGECEVCDAEVSVNFLNCASVDISSCKDLSNVVLVYTDCEWEKFDGLTSTAGSFSGTGTNAGKNISHVYVKSGCYKSGEGPGFGRRFDGPCVNGNCAPISNGNGGKNK